MFLPISSDRWRCRDGRPLLNRRVLPEAPHSPRGPHGRQRAPPARPRGPQRLLGPGEGPGAPWARGTFEAAPRPR
eukprot:7373324-Pyramimonas_sp.AAC.1